MESPLSPFALLRRRTGLSIPEVAKQMGYSKRTVYRWEKGETVPRRSVLEMLEVLIPAERPDPSFTFIDLFAGIGGMRFGFEAIGGQCVFTSEWDRFAQQTYQANFPEDHVIHGDITQIGMDAIPAHDVLLAGFPCQPFSIAGVSKKNALGRPHGFRCEAQGTLFFDIARILEHHRPAAFLLENVKNLVRHDRGHTFTIIQRILKEELGYHIDCRVINAKGWVPQNRERIFIAGFRDLCDFTFESMEVPDVTAGPRLSAILHPEDGSEQEELPFTIGFQAEVAPKYTLSDHLWTYLQKYAEKHRKRGNGFGYGLCSPEDVARTLSARYYKDGSEILIRQSDGRNPRRLTPRECARLMGFDTSDKAFDIPVSDGQAYRQFGNAVAVPVVRAVAAFLEPWFRDAISHPLARQPRQLSLSYGYVAGSHKHNGVNEFSVPSGPDP